MRCCIGNHNLSKVGTVINSYGSATLPAASILSILACGFRKLLPGFRKLSDITDPESCNRINCSARAGGWERAMTASTGWPRRMGSSSRASSCSRAWIHCCHDLYDYHHLWILSWLNKSFVLNFLCFLCPYFSGRGMNILIFCPLSLKHSGWSDDRRCKLLF